MAKKVGITRQQYKDIKKKDHQQMNAFLIRFWQDGYNEGLAAAKKANISPADIENAISGIKGMGETKVKAVMQRIYKLYEEAAKYTKMLSKEMLKIQRVHLQKSNISKKIIYNKDGEIKDITTILKELQRMFKEEAQ